MLREASEFAGTIPVKQLLPFWKTGKRYLYTGGSVQMRDAAIFVRENSWDRAFELWEQVYNGTKKEKKKKKEKTKEQESRAEKAEMAGTVTFSIVLAVGLFMLLPAWIASLLDAVIKSHVLIGLIEGVIRLAIFLGYVIAISRMEDIKRTYMYHGAEHQTINCCLLYTSPSPRDS